ncbi:metallophosphoesterase [Anaerostipes caccae]|nr:metallophosphoesterase [Anaerostipes caccae]MCB6294542.1 metallophosphoesterase [Anaerostipes caccae]MCB6372414.1 metallophosphoesterase [Anaerostipes caccae]MCB7186393.1 metallophosphoesterase [Anaerostipes caccae]MCB7188452.1 metallophosphoesterase [Anaerostipes caccae]MCB7301274.1 metallophosphoesterase [Anaerostipes caccae]
MNENQNLSLEEYTVVSAKLPEEFDGFKIVFLTDLHCNEFDYQNKALIDMIDGCSPDAVFVGGDMLVSRVDSSYEVALDLMRELSRRYRIYYADGNHEMRLKRNEEVYGVAYKEYVHQLKECGVVHLSNESIMVDSGISAICLTAYDMEEKQYRKFHPAPPSLEEMSDALGDADPEFFQVLLAHNPNYFRQYSKWGCDLVLSGHFHGGMVRLPKIGGVISPQFQLFPKYDAGEYQIGTSIMILSRGLGNHSIKIRLLNRPEVSCITLKKK